MEIVVKVSCSLESYFRLTIFHNSLKNVILGLKTEGKSMTNNNDVSINIGKNANRAEIEGG